MPWKGACHEFPEAARNLEGSIESIIPDQPWAQIRAVGNVLRHEYDRVNPIFVWRITNEDLQPLKIAIQSALDIIRRETPDET